MRWFIEVSSGNPTGPAEQWVVEASQWQPALQAARALRGEPEDTTGFSIELLEDGFRVIDPATLVRYVVRRAPDGTPLSATNTTTKSASAAPSHAEVPPSAAPPAKDAVNPERPPVRANGGASPIAASSGSSDGAKQGDEAAAMAVPAPAVVPASAATPSRAPSVAPPPPVTHSPAAAPHNSGATGSVYPPAPGVPAVDMSGMTQAERIAAMLSVDPTPRTSSRAPSAAPKSGAPKSVTPKGTPRSVPAASTRNGGATSRPPRPSESAPPSAAGAALRAPQSAAVRAPRPAAVAEAPPPVAPPDVVPPDVPPAPAAPPEPAAPAPSRLITQPAAAAPVVQSLTELQALVHHNVPPRPSQPPPAAQVPPSQPAALASQPPALASQPPATAETHVSPSVHPSPSSAPEPLPIAELLFQRSEDPSASSPLTYREAAWAVPEGTSIGSAVRLLAGMFEGVRAALSGVKPGKLVYMAIFDHRFVGKPTRPPLATLTWKDWKDQGQGPEIRRQGEPRTSFQPPPVTDSFIPAAVPQPPPSIPSAPPAVSSVAPHAVIPPAPPVAVAPAYPAAAPLPSPYAAPSEAMDAQPVLAPAPAQAAPPIALQSQPGAGALATGDVASPPAEPVAAPVAGPKLVIVPEPVTPLPVVAPSVPAARASMPSAPAVRLSGVELIADLFECMHDLHFLPDALAGADFVLSLMLDKLPSAVALVHFYDIDAREFVVVRAVGAGAAKVMQIRTNEKEPLIAEAMHKRRAVVLDDAAGDPRAQNGRWALIGDPPRSLVCAPVEEGGRFLGLLELSNPLDGQPFREGDGHAITYIGEQFAEFLAERGVILDAERIGN